MKFGQSTIIFFSAIPTVISMAPAARTSITFNNIFPFGPVSVYLFCN